MSFRPWLPLVASVLLPALALSARGEEKQPPSRIEAEIADLEFEVKKRELAHEMAELGVKEAELALERIEMVSAKSDQNILGVDRAEARIHIEMRKLNQEAATYDLAQVRARLERLKTTAESKPANTGPVPLKHTRGEESEQAAAIKRLLKQRRDTLREIVALVEGQFRNGLVQQDAVVRASESLIAAELDLATDKAERIALRERRVENMKRMEEYANVQREIAAVNSTAVLTATAERLKAEIELLQERANE